MSRAKSVEEPKTINWMLEDFPDDLKQRCKEKAISQRKTLKAFVKDALQLALEIDSTHENGQARIKIYGKRFSGTTVRHSTPP